MRRVLSCFLTHRYAALCVALWALMLVQTTRGQWVGDFWEHSAVVRELATHLAHPRHPQLLLDAPHAFVSPYSVGVALLARGLGGNVVLALALAGMVNLVLLLVGLWLFVVAVAPKHAAATAFYTLLLTLLGWGAGVWYFSGFFHLGVIGYVLPYPSTFAMGLTLMALWVNGRRVATSATSEFRLAGGSLRRLQPAAGGCSPKLAETSACQAELRPVAGETACAAERDGQAGWANLIAVFAIAAVVLLAHPITFFLLAAGLTAQAVTSPKWRREFLVAVSVLAAAFALALCWPYFPVLRLFLGEARVYDGENRVMYQQVLTRTWPVLLGVPLLAYAAWRNWRRSLGVMFVLLAGLYALGAFTGKFSYGRVLPQMALLLHLTIAGTFALLEARLAGPDGARWRRLLVPTAAITLALWLGWPLVQAARWLSFGEHQPSRETYAFLARHVGQYEVVLADLPTAWPVPTFGGKIVAALHPLAFVPDHEQRKEDVARFFRNAATRTEREEVIAKYAVDYLLVRKTADGNWRALRDEFLPPGGIVHENGTFALISLKPRSH